MEKNNGMGLSIASMVLGICSVVFSCCVYFIALPCAVVGVVLAAVSLKNNNGGKGMAVTGLVTSIVSIVPTIISIAAGASIMSRF